MRLSTIYVYMRPVWPAITQLLSFLQQFSGNFIKSLELHLNGSIDPSYKKGFLTQTEYFYCLHRMLSNFINCSSKLTFCVNIPLSQLRDTLPLIGSTLMHSSVQPSNNVRFLFSSITGIFQLQQSFPIRAISDWLHRQYACETPLELTIGSGNDHLLNIRSDSVVQLIDALKIVRLLF